MVINGIKNFQLLPVMTFTGDKCEIKFQMLPGVDKRNKERHFFFCFQCCGYNTGNKKEKYVVVASEMG